MRALLVCLLLIATGASPVSAAPAQADIATVDALLDALERAGDDLRGFTSKVVYVTHFVFEDARERRFGNVVYQAESSQAESSGSESSQAGSGETGVDKRLAIVFDKLIATDGSSDASRRHYVFSGDWMIDVDHRRKQVIERQIVKPGAGFDPFRLDAGFFPLPIDQPKADVLRRFDVTWIDEIPEKLEGMRIGNVYGLRLVPKAGQEIAEEFSRIDVYYDRTTLLPVGVDAEETSGDRKIVRLLKPRVNQPFSSIERGFLVVGEFDPAEWRIERLPWRGE